ESGERLREELDCGTTHCGSAGLGRHRRRPPTSPFQDEAGDDYPWPSGGVGEQRRADTRGTTLRGVEVPEFSRGEKYMPSIFITGGAAGIGLATAERFGREGWTVGVYDVDTAALAEVQATHPDWITGELDVRDPDQWVRALDEFTSHTGGTLDVLDNNAG